jgi:hypothetical protein
MNIIGWPSGSRLLRPQRSPKIGVPEEVEAEKGSDRRPAYAITFFLAAPSAALAIPERATQQAQGRRGGAALLNAAMVRPKAVPITAREPRQPDLRVITIFLRATPSTKIAVRTERKL